MSGISIGAIEYIADPGFEEGLRKASDTRGALSAFAEKALEGVREAAPVLTGRYRDSWSVQEGDYWPELMTTSSFWELLEYGSVHNVPFAPIRRGLESAGLDLVD